MGDHTVQAAYLGHWSFTNDKDRRGKVYAYRKGDSAKEWFAVGINNILTEKRGDKLSPGEVCQLNEDAEGIRKGEEFVGKWTRHPQMEIQRLLNYPDKPISESSLDEDLLHPIESHGYAALCDAAENPDGIKQNLNFHWLAKWVLLHFYRTPAGKRELACRVQRELSSELGRPVSYDEVLEVLKSRDCGLNYIFYLGYLHGEYNQARSPKLHELYMREWAVREVEEEGELICSDNPVLNVGNIPRSFIVPLEPRKALYIHESGPTVNPQPLIAERISTLNAIQRANADHWLISRIPNPPIFSEKELEEHERTLTLRFENRRIPRNAKCPCGSGRKYKNCCGKT